MVCRTPAVLSRAAAECSKRIEGEVYGRRHPMARTPFDTAAVPGAAAVWIASERLWRSRAGEEILLGSRGDESHGAAVTQQERIAGPR